MRAVVAYPVVIALLGAASPVVRAGDIHVPADFPTIQGAIDGSFDGDVILVAPGTYVENIDFKGKAIAVQSTGGAALTTIDGGGVDSVVKFLNSETPASILDGFTITGGYGYIGYCGCTSVGGGIVISEKLGGTSSDPTIIRCRIASNTAIDGGGIYSSYCAPMILDCIIDNNSAGGQGGGLWISNASLDGAMPILVNTTVFGNSAPSGAGALISSATSSSIVNCVFWSNGIAGGATLSFCDVEGGYSGNGNIDADPKFTNPQAGDFHLGLGSPCLDSGDGSALSLPTTDFDGDPRIVGVGVDIGADEFARPIVSSVTPIRDRYDRSPTVSVNGGGFLIGAPISVRFGPNAATNVTVIDDANLTCDAPTGRPGAVDVGIANPYGEGVLSSGFLYTPAITIDGDPTLGSTITIHDLCTPGDGIFAVFGLPPSVSVPTPPFDGNLAIVPFHYFFYVAAWPFDSFDVPVTIPNDPSFAGVDVLLQSLVGSSLTMRPKSGAWTNCSVLSIH